MEVTALHDLVRLGVPGRATARLQRLAAGIDGELVRVCAAQAAASVQGNGHGLESAAAAFGRLGMTLFAAEAHAQAAVCHRSAGDAASACRASLRAAELAARCQGARTPALTGIEAPSLTPREREIARLAASGMSSREIATVLTVSIRTVGNHLQSVYGKLGVNRRSDLTVIFGA
jgi:DNA-binding CsgD family transcriptional regulator